MAGAFNRTQRGFMGDRKPKIDFVFETSCKEALGFTNGLTQIREPE